MFKKFFYLFPFSIQYYISRLSSFFISNFHEDFIYNSYGKEYGITRKDRILILKKIKLSLSKVKSATSFETQITLVKKILSIKKNKFIYIVECGCFKGSSTIALSIAAKLINAKLIVYDSFVGLPFSEKSFGLRKYPHLNLYGFYKKGMYSGSLEEVKNNVKIYGEISVCEFRKGNFNNTLKNHSEKIDFCFIDVDLTTSTQECIKYLWKKLKENCYFFTDDACDLEVVKIWFDHVWWKKNFNIKPPGYIGSGCGLPISGNFSGLGYAYKNNKVKPSNLKKFNWLYEK
jgi:O-methyltransferase